MVAAGSEVAEAIAGIPSPVLSFVRSMRETDGKWELRGEYSIWAGSPGATDTRYLLHEWRANRVVPIRATGTRPVMHRIASGTPFEVAHLFGFWITVDVDAVWIDAGDQGGQYCALVVGGTQGKPAEAVCSFVCPKCGAPFSIHPFVIPHQHFERFLDFAQSRVREFNADAQQRTCPKCGFLHPPSYGFHAKLDTAAERKARQAA